METWIWIVLALSLGVGIGGVVWLLWETYQETRRDWEWQRRHDNLWGHPYRPNSFRTNGSGGRRTARQRRALKEDHHE
jgi:hypothetical protein